MPMQVDLTGTAPAGPSNKTLPADAIGDARQQAFQRAMQTLLGKSVQGAVQSRLNDGSFLVKVAGTSARMMLPPGAQVGADVAMTLVALNPRPTFQISSGDKPPTLAYAEAGPEDGLALRSNGVAAGLLGKAAAATLLQPLAAGEPDPSISDAARAINTLLARAHSRPNPPQAILGATPLMVASASAPAQLAQALQDAIKHSGLFYESHVAEWAEGKRSLADLQREPQMQKQIAETDLEAAQLINLQLRTHEQDKVRWQGELWPGQKMAWEIDKDAPDGDDGDDDDRANEPVWRSGVRFQFPTLGKVEASVMLVGSQLHIQIRADSVHSADALRTQAGTLQQSLEASGAALSSLSIRGQADDVE